MGRSGNKRVEGKAAAVGARAGVTSRQDASAAAVGGLNASATLEALFKTLQGVSSAAGGMPNEASRLMNGNFNDPMRALAQNPALLSRMAKNVLPQSAPASSLLPPIPAEGLSPQALMALQTQLSAIGAAPASLHGSGTSTGSMGHQSAHGGPGIAVVQQLLKQAAAATTAPKPALPTSTTNSVAPNMQSWSLERLEQHVNLLHQLKQPVPESVSVLLADGKRKLAKKTAKRLANRKSASSSRARKKALVQEMTELNSRLKRQAQILALLPDLVITINVDGVITFSSAQVERVLHHNSDEIVGTKMADLLVASSRDKLNRLVVQLVASEQMAALGIDATEAAGVTNESGNDTEQAMEASNVEGSRLGGENSSEVAVVSEPSFPLSIVKVKTKEKSSDENDISDNSASLLTSKGPSSLTQDSTSIPRSPMASSLGKSGAYEAKNGGKEKAGKKNLPSSDTSNTSSISTTAKKLQKANQNLEKNVRAHNKKMKKGCPSYRDDVTGADVTANNATARLSSLQHRSESSSEEDSGYRESNDSREETSSSASESSESNGRRKPLAPTCTICLIRKDMTTVWCEVTSSIRTVERVRDSLAIDGVSDDGKSRKSVSKIGTKSEEESAPSETEAPPEKELLLCLRPIRDGKVKMEGELGLDGISKKKSPAASTSRSQSSKPPRKRCQADAPLEDERPAKKAATEAAPRPDNEVAESLMATNKQA